MMCRLFSSRRLFSSFVTVEKKEKYAIVRMNRAPVNSLNVALLQDLTNTIVSLQDDKQMHGMILASHTPKIFSAGLDIMEMYQPTEESLATFWNALQTLFLTYYTTPLVSIAAIEGHAPAGGCLLAMASDYRIMTTEGRPRIGLNETQLGIVAPKWFQSTLVNTIGHRQAELMLQLGLQYDAKKAMEIDLVDECVETISEVLPAAEKAMGKWLTIPKMARSRTKMELRGHVTKALQDTLQEDADLFATTVLDPMAQKSLEMYLNSLKARKK